MDLNGGGGRTQLALLVLHRRSIVMRRQMAMESRRYICLICRPIIINDSLFLDAGRRSVSSLLSHQRYICVWIF